jgi:uncharacterized membrane protein
VNDPTAAVQALDQIESLLRVLATRDLSMENIADSSGTIRVTLAHPPVIGNSGARTREAWQIGARAWLACS